MGWFFIGVLLIAGWLVAAVLVILVVRTLHSTPERPNWSSFIDREFDDNQENLCQVREEAAAIAEKSVENGAPVSHSGETETVNALLDAYRAHSLGIKEALEVGEISSAQVSKLRELGDGLRQADLTVRHSDTKTRDDIRRTLERHEERVRSLDAVLEEASRETKSQDQAAEASPTAKVEGKAKAAKAGQ